MYEKYAYAFNIINAPTMATLHLRIGMVRITSESVKLKLRTKMKRSAAAAQSPRFPELRRPRVRHECVRKGRRRKKIFNFKTNAKKKSVQK